MNRSDFNQGQGGNARQTILHMQAAIKDAFAYVLSSYTAQASAFIISGCTSTENTVGGVTTVTLQAGVAVLNGEPFEVPAQVLTRTASEVMWLAPFEEFVDATPALNAENVATGNQVKRTLKLFKGTNFPAVGQFVGLTAPTQAKLIEDTLGSRLLRRGVMYPIDTDDIPLIPANWTNTGLGITGTPAAGLALCNGLNGTIDMRGVTPMGASLTDFSSGAGALPNGVVSEYTVEQVVGTESVTLTIEQMPAHIHTFDDRGLVSPGAEVAQGDDYVRTEATEQETSSVGGGAAHENRQPSKALVWVKVL